MGVQREYHLVPRGRVGFGLFHHGLDDGLSLFGPQSAVYKIILHVHNYK